jgi:amino acid transporter
MGELMTDQSAATVSGVAPVGETKLEPNAISTAQDTIIGMASSAPAATVGLSVAGLAAATAYGATPVMLISGAAMLIIANSYRRLNLWKANVGASFEWVGRAINPYLGFLTGWLMIVAYILGTVSAVLVLGPNVLAVFNYNNTNTGAYIAIAVVVTLVMLVIAVVGIKITARVQVGMAAIEYLILFGIAIAGLIFVANRHPGVVPLSSGWLNLNGIGGKGDAVSGFLIAVFIYGGWDGTLYVNEEVKHRRVNPGRSAVLAVALLAILYTLAQAGFQGVLSPAKLATASNNGTALTAVAQAVGGSFWAKAMALSLALSVIATTGTGIVLTARIVYGMATYRTLPSFLGNVSPRFRTPVASSVIVGLLLALLGVIYLAATSVQNAFNNVIDVTGLLFSVFYIFTALAAMTYYRRRILSNVWDFILVGLLPLAAAVFLGYVFVKSVAAAPWEQRWAMIGILAAGIVLMLVARFILRSSFFQLPRESGPKEAMVVTD